MKKLLLAFVCIYSFLSFAQTEDESKNLDNKIRYYQDFISFKGNDDKTRLDFFIKVPYNAVQFVKTGQGFEASYTVTVSIFSEDKSKLITEKSGMKKL